MAHLARAKSRVVLCAPFIKVGVLNRLLSVVAPDVSVEIFTRWHAEEIAAGVSDLDVFDVTSSRPLTTLKLLDNLHAKLYFSDEALLAGSANLTATALGWCKSPNLELLTLVPSNESAVLRCVEALAFARVASAAERSAMQLLVDNMPRTLLPSALPLEMELASMWIPRLAAPEKLFLAYRPSSRDRLVESVLSAADHDLSALCIAPGLSEADFKAEVAKRFSAMPAMAAVLRAASTDLSDAAGIELLGRLSPVTEMSVELLWGVTREWLTYFLGDRYEIAPQSYVTRLRSGVKRE
ncbi:phospholipase D family protein [Pseudomonas sp. FP1154]|uniref:phospholipase D family protein n=1 Tax=Pseudomonas sp. FP1154 TaxID=2954077 RepID=UPI00273558FA|nr:phospholipase D family protein [Pseudomonas sp. FP1154]WLG22642.1 phospholipase D family protein [Pseudomonas sp. FP1154]